jgi:hypothetical protein
MAILINDNYSLQACKPFDARYLNICTPWTSVAAVNAAIPTYRYTGLTVNIMGTEYWYANGIADINLVVKDSGIASTGLTTAINGLTKFGNAVRFGGTITGATTITDSRGVSAVGIQYGGDYCANFTARSLVDAAYVTGKTNVINTVGTIGQIIYRDSTHLVGCANMIYCDALPSFAFGVSNIASGANSASIGGLSNTVTAVCSAIIAGQSNCIGSGNIGSVILGGSNISLTASTNCCVVVVPNLSIWCTPSGSGNLLTWNSVTKKVGVTNVSASGSLTGATNGLCKYDSNDICLGGALVARVSITGNQPLCLGTSGSKLASLDLQTAGALTIVAGTLPISSSGATFTDLTAISKQGIKYASDYSLTYDPRSLVDKGYVDRIATGLNVHASVAVATTAPITLSGNQTIDGVLTTTSMRVLVKNQTSGATNGIYTANSSAWSRASDYTGNTQVTNGDLIPVTSGSTQNSSIWVLVTPEPITVGTTSLLFTEFSTVIDVQGGQGICITQVGGTHTVCVNPVSGCGLSVDPAGLCINNSIGGNGLTYSGGVINANACSCGAVAAINVGYNGSDNLVVACSDITSMAAIVTGATNGLTKTGQKVILGGNLTGATCIGVDSTLCLCGSVGQLFTFGPLGTQLSQCTSNLTITNSGADVHLTSCTGKAVLLGVNALVYCGDYESCFIPRSLITKQYVQSYVTGGTTVLTACNGLTKQANNNVVLGGALTGNTCLCTSTHRLYICNDTCIGLSINCVNGGLGYVTIGNIPETLAHIRVDEDICICGGTYGNVQGRILMTSENCVNAIVAQYGRICLTVTGAGSFVIGSGGTAGGVFKSGDATTGIKYSDVSTSWMNTTPTALVTAAWVNSQITGGTGISNANNGLTKVGNAVKLGGTLTGTTTINGGQTFNINQNIFNLSGSTSVNITSPIVTLQTTPPVGLTSDAVLVWNSVDKNIKTVSGAALGDKNNVYSHSAVTTSVLLTTGSSYVILVNNSAPVTITLPATPLNGQVFKIKNVSGSAVTNIITVAGNGKNIDGSSTGLINTDYGALELIYDLTLRAWYSLAFIN